MNADKRRSKILAIAYLTMLLIPSHLSPAAENRWLHLKSANFDMYSSDSPRNSRETIRTFEQVGEFLQQVFGGHEPNPVPVRLVAFGSVKEFEPYRPIGFAVAYYQPTAERDYIVMSHCSPEMFPIAVHEYVHLLVRRADLHLPLWVSEGLADLYSTVRPAGNRILLGDLIPGRRKALLEQKWVPLRTILAAGKGSPYYSEKEKAGSFYNESWALMHMLRFRTEYRARFRDLLKAVKESTDSEQTLMGIYGRTLEQIERDLRDYLSDPSFQGEPAQATMAKATDESSIEPLSDFDTGLILADLLYGPGSEAAQRAALERLAQRDPRRPEPHRELGYLAWRAGPQGVVLGEFDKAFGLGDHDPRFLLDYARLLEAGGRVPQAVRILSGLLAHDSRNVDVRLELAEALVRSDDARSALNILRGLDGDARSHPPLYFRIASEVHLRNGDPRSAAEAATRFRELAKTDEERAQADLLASEAAALEANVKTPSLDTQPLAPAQPKALEP
jgi:hypothetical protein